MTVDTSREAVEDLIARMSHDELNEFADFPLAADTLAALLDERDELSRQLGREEMRSDGRAQRIRELETETVRLRAAEERAKTHYDNAIKWRDRAERAEAALEGSEQSRLAGEQKLAGVQAERNKLLGRAEAAFGRAQENADKFLGRALAAEAERDEAVKERVRLETQNDILWAGLNDAKVHIERVEAERDRLAAKLDAVKEWLTNEDKATEMSWSDYNCGRGDAAREVLAILADTDEGSSDE